MKLPIQYADRRKPDTSCKCLRPARLSTTKYETMVVMLTLKPIDVTKAIKLALIVVH